MPGLSGISNSRDPFKQQLGTFDFEMPKRMMMSGGYAAKLEQVYVPDDDVLVKLKNNSYLTGLPGFSEHKLDLNLLKSMNFARQSALSINLKQQHRQRQH